MLLISPSITMYSIDDDNKLLREIAYSTIFLSGLFVAIFASAGAITQEVESKTASTVLSKPVPRFIFVLGKYFGIAGAVAIAHFLSSVVMMLIIRNGVMQTARDELDWTVITLLSAMFILAVVVGAFANYSWGWNFCSTAVITASGIGAIGMLLLYFTDKQWRFNPAENHFAIFDFYSVLLLLLAILVLVSVAVLFSTRCNIVITLLMCIGVFLLGLVSDYLFGRHADTNLLSKITYMVLPNLQVFWISDAIYLDSSVPAGYVLRCSLYALCYSTGMISLATALFRGREVG
jgi:hypothetical protein